MAYPYSYDYEAERKEKENKLKLPTNRSALKLSILSILTLGLYSIAFFMPLSYDLDKIAPKRDRSKTMNYFLAYVLATFTLSIVMMFWHYHIAERIEEALDRRHIDYDFGTGTFWGWYVCGSFILVGPFVYFAKLCKAMNLLCADYNERPYIPEEDY